MTADRFWPWHISAIAGGVAAGVLLWGELFIPEKWSGFELYGPAFIAWFVLILLAGVFGLPEDFRLGVVPRVIGFVCSTVAHFIAAALALVGIYAAYDWIWGPYLP